MISPEITEFHIDMDTGILHLTFSETVNVTSIDVRNITVYTECSIMSDE